MGIFSCQKLSLPHVMKQCPNDFYIKTLLEDLI